MKTYRLYKNEFNVVSSVSIENMSIPICADNTDYAQFKKAISEETAQLQDADGNLMTSQAAKDFIKELP
jgi:hypothetical protein